MFNYFYLLFDIPFEGFDNFFDRIESKIMYSGSIERERNSILEFPDILAQNPTYKKLSTPTYYLKANSSFLLL